MRCSLARRLSDAYVEGRLDPAHAKDLERHAASCTACAERIGQMRALREALLTAPAPRAPAGFGERVMAGVYRQALSGRPGRDERAVARGYRRLGLSFLVTAAVLAVSLLIPRTPYAKILGGPGITREGTVLVRGLLAGADDAVQKALGEQGKGGSAR